MASTELQRAALDELIATLNPAQREAVEHLEGPLLIFAGAGSGKTRVLTTRIANLIAKRKVWPDRLLAVTFTNKAAREMRERVGRLVGGADRMWVGTFHATAVRIVRRCYERYEQVLQRSGGLDFDDLIVKVVRLLQTDEEARARWQDRFRHVLVDEYQDTNRAQYVLVNAIAG